MGTDIFKISISVKKNTSLIYILLNRRVISTAIQRPINEINIDLIGLP